LIWGYWSTKRLITPSLVYLQLSYEKRLKNWQNRVRLEWSLLPRLRLYYSRCRLMGSNLSWFTSHKFLFHPLILHVKFICLLLSISYCKFVIIIS